jgi:uncharacterized coiled-coil DUF342 family protein
MANLFSVKNPNHAEALQRKDRFLSKHPELKELQKRIDDKLDKAATFHNRLVIIHDLMMESFLEMNRRLRSLTGRSR